MGFLLDFAIAIYLYTLEDPAIYKLMNGAMFAPGRETADGSVSDDIRACLPYIKFLDKSLISLPEKYHFKGRCFRGVKWVFPSTDKHDPESYFYEGKEFYFYEFKSSSHTVRGSDDSCSIFSTPWRSTTKPSLSNRNIHKCTTNLSIK